MRRALLALALLGAACAEREPPALDSQPRRAMRLVGDVRRDATSARRGTDALSVQIPPGATRMRFEAAVVRKGVRAWTPGAALSCHGTLRPSGRVIRFEASPEAGWILHEAGVAGDSSAELRCEDASAGDEVWISEAVFSRPSEPRRNVLLVSLDTMRLDALGRPGVTPALDRLASQGTTFRHAFSPAPWTLPAHVSVMTGLLPSWHGRWDPRTRDHVLPAVPTLAEILRERGWETLAITGEGSISWTLGSTRGFGAVIEHEPTKSAASRECDASAERAARFLRSRRPDDPPFLLFWHTYEPHAPYHDARFAGSTEPLPPGIGEDAREDWLRYLGDVAAADAALRTLLDALVETGLDSSTDVIVLSDHGEEFGEHSGGRRDDATRHGHGLWDTLLRVPVIVRAKALPPGVRDDAVSLVDVFPTVLELAGVPEPPSQGMSLLRPGGRAAIAAEALYPDYAPHEQKAWRTATRKHVTTLSVPPRAHDHDLVADPRELSEIAPSAALTAEAAAFWSEAPLATAVRARAPGGEIPPELLESLRSLGYVR